MSSVNVSLCVATFRTVLNAEKLVTKRKKELDRYLRHLTDEELAEYAEATEKMIEES